jgi:hypothetical protein
MDKQDELYFLGQLNKYKNQLIKNIQPELEEIFKQALDISVYNAYTPTEYNRTYALRNSVRSKIEDGKLLLYIDTDTLSYYSVYNTNRNVSEAVPFWIESGHMDSSGIENQFHDYEARYYLEQCKQLIISKYGNTFEVNIINDIPPNV